MSLPSIDSTHTPPGRADVRSPCPGLNTLANHGILPHDGRDITPDMLVQAMTSTFHMSEGLARFFANGSRAVASNPLTGKINLDDLNRHNVLEHDASLSRADAGERPGGDNHSFNKTIFDGFMAHYAGMEHTTLEAAAKARHDRFLEGKASDESFRFGAKEYTLSYGETALYLQVLGGAKAARAKVEHVRVFFEEERLPCEEGWRPSVDEISQGTINATMAELVAVTPDKEPEINGVVERGLDWLFETVGSLAA